MSDLLERLHKLQVDADTRHLPTELTYECRMAISGKGPRAFDWSDKPHRLVYDLSREVERLTAERDAARADRDSHQREAIRAMEERDAALAKVTQYEQAPVVGWASKVGLDRIAAAQWREHQAYTDLRNWRFDTNIPEDDTALIARPEVTK
jgi:hypothetical protein